MSLSDTLARQAGSVDLGEQSHEGGKVSKAENKNRCFFHVFRELLLSKKGAMLLPIERLKEGNSKCRHLKKLSCKGTLRQVFICLRPRTPYPPPVHTVKVYTVYFFAQERGGGRTEPERRREGQQFTKLGQKYQHD
jgi:hypothetical protein